MLHVRARVQAQGKAVAMDGLHAVETIEKAVALLMGVAVGFLVWAVISSGD